MSNVKYETCPRCTVGRNEPGLGGVIGGCFHCDNCGYLQCAEESWAELVALGLVKDFKSKEKR